MPDTMESHQMKLTHNKVIVGICLLIVGGLVIRTATELHSAGCLRPVGSSSLASISADICYYKDSWIAQENMGCALLLLAMVFSVDSAVRSSGLIKPWTWSWRSTLGIAFEVAVALGLGAVGMATIAQQTLSGLT